MSLKQILNQEIRERGYISTNDLEAICHLNNYKVSNGERRLRESESVEPERNSKGAITGYRYKPEEKQDSTQVVEQDKVGLFPSYPKLQTNYSRWRE